MSGSNFMKGKVNSRQGAQGGNRVVESFDLGSRNNIEKAMQAYSVTANNKKSGESNHKRS